MKNNNKKKRKRLMGKNRSIRYLKKKKILNLKILQYFRYDFSKTLLKWLKNRNNKAHFFVILNTNYSDSTETYSMLAKAGDPAHYHI